MQDLCWPQGSKGLFLFSCFTPGSLLQVVATASLTLAAAHYATAEKRLMKLTKGTQPGRAPPQSILLSQKEN